jgi:predicted DNA-binding transcriptional regulator AlpA
MQAPVSFGQWSQLSDPQESAMQKLNVIQAATYTSLSKSSLNKLRVYGGGPIFIKVGARVVYDRIDLDAWLAGKKIANTSQSPPVAA